MDILHTRMDQPKKRRLIRKKPVDDDYCYGPYSLEEDKYSPADIVRARITQRIEKEKFYSTFCPPVIYDFINDKDITKPVEVPLPVKTIDVVKSSFNIIPADKLREAQRETPRDSRDDKRDSRDDKRDYRITTRDNDYHRNRDREYERTTRQSDPPNPYNGNSYKPSKAKMELDSELGKYCRKF